MSPLHGFAPFRALGAIEAAALLDGSREAVVAAGRSVIRRDDLADRMVLLLEGQLRVGATSPDGRALTFRVVQPVELVGEIAVLDRGPRTADVEALTRSRVLVLPGEAVRRAVAAHPLVAAAFVQLLCARLRETSTGMEGLATLRLPERLEALLRRLARERATDGAMLLPRISQGEIAAMVGATREAVNKQLSAWREEGLVAVRGGRLALLPRRDGG